MRQENVTNRIEILEIEVTNTGTCVDQDIIVDQHCRGSRAGANTTTATKHANSHNEGSLELRHMG